MKNSKKSVKMLLVKSLGSLLIALPLVATAGNGGAYNGPTFSTVAIPGSVERGISIQNIEKAYRTCGITGDKSRGLKPLLKSVAENLGLQGEPVEVPSLFPNDLNDQLKELKKQTSEGSKAERFTIVPKLRGYVGKQESKAGEICAVMMDMSSNTYVPISLRFNESRSCTELSNVSLGGQDESEYTIYPKVSAKVLDSDKTDNKYDQFGRMIEQNGPYLRGLSIETNSLTKTIVNIKTKQPVMNIDFSDFVMCLQSEIQRYLE